MVDLKVIKAQKKGEVVYYKYIEDGDRVIIVLPSCFVECRKDDIAAVLRKLEGAEVPGAVLEDKEVNYRVLTPIKLKVCGGTATVETFSAARLSDGKWIIKTEDGYVLTDTLEEFAQEVVQREIAKLKKAIVNTLESENLTGPIELVLPGRPVEAYSTLKNILPILEDLVTLVEGAHYRLVYNIP